jgi:hypothetical protein
MIKSTQSNRKSKMNSIAPALVQKLQNLPPQRLAEVEDFVEFLALREMRATAGARLGESLAKLDSLNINPLTDEEINLEIQAARQSRNAVNRT